MPTVGRPGPRAEIGHGFNGAGTVASRAAPPFPKDDATPASVMVKDAMPTFPSAT
jgi:hypothetical protein